MPSTGYRRPLIAGTEIAVYCDSYRAGTTIPRSHQPYAALVLPGEGANCELVTYDENGKPTVHRIIGGRQVAFVAPNVWHSYRWEGDSGLLVIYARRRFLNKHLRGRMWSGAVVGEFVQVAAKDPLIWRLASLCRELCGEPQTSERRLIENSAHSLARRAFASNFGGEAVQGLLPIMTREQQKVIFDYLEKHIIKVLSNSEMSRLAGLSERYFSRLFTNTTGMPPKRYQNRCRMRRAEQMLMSGKYRVKEIARDLGFSSVSYFDRCFHQFFGARPGLYFKRKNATLRPEHTTTGQGVSGQSRPLRNP